MLKLRNIQKEFDSGGGAVHALRGVSLEFRTSEFVAILGPSGCGKTTLLNIIGGLDRASSGTLKIDGTSTAKFGDREWDSYRNHSVGFVFQSYNLIPHLDALSNVEMALKISGSSKEERQERAEAALEDVGLKDQAHKKPSQMSGGQMQRVAIARALVNDPSIVLADEPTGALDSETSRQVMEILANVARDRLVIMVTHNPELAEQYASRIIRMKDGTVQSDSNPPSVAELAAPEPGATFGKAKLGFLTALSLSAKNLMTKKGRTVLTAFAGAIGIIGIALILALSSGMNDYIADVEHDTMGNYPIELEAQTIDMSSAMGAGSEMGSSGLLGTSDDGESEEEAEGIYSNNVVAPTVEAEQSTVVENNLSLFKDYLEGHEEDIADSLAAVEYGYDVEPLVMREYGEENEIVTVSPSELDTGDEDASGMSSMAGASGMGAMSGGMGAMGSGSSSASSTWQQLPADDDLARQNYELVAGTWPEGSGEAALVIDADNQVSDYVLYTLGLLDLDDMDALVDAVENGEEYEDDTAFFEYDDALGLTFKTLAACDLYAQDENGVWYDASGDADMLAAAYDAAPSITITAVLRAGDEASVQSGVVYTSELTCDLMARAEASDVVQKQLADPSTNVLTGEAFETADDGAAESEDEVTSDDEAAEDTAVGADATAVAFGFESAASNGLYEDGSSSASSAVYRMSDATLRTASYETESDGDVSDDGTGDASGESGEVGETGEAGEPDERLRTVVFKNFDGIELAELELESGMTPTYEGEEPEQPDSDGMTYTFIGWQNEETKAVYLTGTDLPAVDGDVTYVAFYCSSATEETPSGEQGAQSGQGQQGQQSGGSGMGALTGEQGSSQMPSYSSGSIDMSSYYSALGSSSQANGGLASASASAAEQYVSATAASVYVSAVPDTYEDVLAALGYATADDPASISLYPSDFEGKEQIEEFIAAYNDQVAEGDQVTYTDLVSLMTSSISSIVDIISAILIAFVAVSLVVSSIMIAIITYISVLERTKEIGILRAIGASKNDVSKIFNAETVIEGLLSGIAGVVIAVAICIPINAVIGSMFGVEDLASLPVYYGVLLVAISVALTFLAGFIPSRIAAKKDPVVALRAE